MANFEHYKPEIGQLIRIGYTTTTMAILKVVIEVIFYLLVILWHFVVFIVRYFYCNGQREIMNKHLCNR
nr:MAG TPA: hypothetical protein [Caudoviricetes sp.]